MLHPDQATAHWVTVFTGEQLEALSLDAGLEACGFRTSLREAPGSGEAYQLSVPPAEAEAVQGYLEQRWHEEKPPVPVDEELVRRVHALGLRVRHGAFWMPPLVFSQAVSYLVRSGALPVRPPQHGLTLAACWFSVVATLSAGGLAAYLVAQ